MLVCAMFIELFYKRDRNMLRNDILAGDMRSITYLSRSFFVTVYRILIVTISLRWHIKRLACSQVMFKRIITLSCEY